MDPTKSACLLLAAYGATLWASQGEYSPFAILITFVAFLLFCTLYLADFANETRERTLDRILTGLFLLFYGLVFIHPMLRAMTNGLAAYALRSFLLVALPGFALFQIARLRAVGFWITFLALAQAHFMVLLVDPEPRIDIFLFYQKGTAHVLAGQNPYLQPDYPEIYRGRYGYPPGIHYLPVSLWSLAPFRALFGDVRVGLWVAQVASALLLGWIARSRGLTQRVQGLAVLVWLMFPAGLPVLENCWMDALVAGWTLAALLMWIRHRWKLGALFFALALATKQTTLIILFVSFAWFALRRHREGLKSLGLALAGALLLMLPYALWHWPSFWSSTTQVFRNDVRLDSFNLIALAINAYGLEVQFWQTLLIYAALLPIVLWRLARAPGWADWMGGVIMLIGLAFYFGKQAFLNYWDMLSLFVLAFVVLSVNPGDGAESREPTP